MPRGSRKQPGGVRRPEVVLPALRPAPDGGPEPEGDYDGLEFAGAELGPPADGTGASFLDCALRDCGLDEARLAGARFVDCVLDGVRGVGADLSGAVLRDVELHGARLGGLQLHGAVLDRVLIRGGKIDYPNLRRARLTDVVFEDCVLVEADFGGSVMERVSFSGCALRRIDLGQAELKDVDLRAVAELDIAAGVDRLAGSVISPDQLIELAAQFASVLGIRVESQGDSG